MRAEGASGFSRTLHAHGAVQHVVGQLALRALKACNRSDFLDKAGRLDDLKTNEDWSTIREQAEFQEIIAGKKAPENSIDK